MNRIQEYFKLEVEKIETPDVYLGATLAGMNLYSGQYCSTMWTEQYVNAAVTNIEEKHYGNDKK